MSIIRFVLALALVWGIGCGTAEPKEMRAQRALLGQEFDREGEPNDTALTATPITTDTVVRAPIAPGGERDMYSFEALAGHTVYAATMTAGSSSASSDSTLQIIGSDGTTPLEIDLDDGSFSSGASSIAGTQIPSDGTYYVLVQNPSATAQLRPYDLHFRVQPASALPEAEPNDDEANANALPPLGHVAGETSSAADVDVYELELNAGDTVYAALDLDPERDTTEWDGILGLLLTNGVLVQANDSGSAGPDSEALFETVREAGTYYVVVSSDAGFGTYRLSVSVHPGVAETTSCSTFASTAATVTIPSGPGLATMSLTVPGSHRIADLDVGVRLQHTFTSDLDVTLTAPGGATIGLFDDVGNSTVGGPEIIDIVFDDEAARVPVSNDVLDGVLMQPEAAFRLGWLDGMQAGGTWTLTVRDDAADDGGSIQGFGLTICEPLPVPACTGVASTPYSNDFETNGGGFTHSGDGDDWERGAPSAAPLIGCNSGSSCWKTDLDGTYDASASHELVSPPIDLTGYELGDAITLSWALRFQLESVTFDQAWIEIRNVNDSDARRLWAFVDGTMTAQHGMPITNIQQSSGWGVHTASIADYAGQTVELAVHLASDDSVQLGGLALDDVRVTACADAIAVDGGADAAVDAATDATVVDDASEPDDEDSGFDEEDVPTVNADSGVAGGSGGMSANTGGMSANTGGMSANTGGMNAGGASGEGGASGMSAIDAGDRDGGDGVDAGGDTGSSDDGCGCSVPGQSRSNAPIAWPALWLVLGFIARRARRRAGPRTCRR